jgi:hypothetical protein
MYSEVLTLKKDPYHRLFYGFPTILAYLNLPEDIASRYHRKEAFEDEGD